MNLTEEYLDTVNNKFPYLIVKYYENIKDKITLIYGKLRLRGYALGHENVDLVYYGVIRDW